MRCLLIILNCSLSSDIVKKIDSICVCYFTRQISHCGSHVRGVAAIGGVAAIVKVYSSLFVILTGWGSLKTSSKCRLVSEIR